MMSLEARAYTRAEAQMLREQDYDLSACARCVEMWGLGPKALTQWPVELLRMDRHRQLCPKHYEEETA